jgi:hypothetical protein
VANVVITTAVLTDAIRFLEKVYTGNADADRLVYIVAVFRKEIEDRKNT